MQPTHGKKNKHTEPFYSRGSVPTLDSLMNFLLFKQQIRYNFFFFFFKIVALQTFDRSHCTNTIETH